MQLKQIIFIFFITSSITHGSIKKEKNWQWNIICDPRLIIKVYACSHGTYFTTATGTISDPVHNREKISVLLALGVAQSIEQKEISKKQTAFLITAASSRYLALIFNPEKPDTIDFYDIDQPSKIFSSDLEEVQELKRILAPSHNLQK